VDGAGVRRRAVTARRRSHPPVSTGFPAFTQPRIPSGMTNSFPYPSFAASRAASWLAVQLGLAQ
jgi:hypothetical protein